MAEFVYRALDARKQFVTGQLQAASTNAAVEQLIELGYIPLSTTPGTRDRRTGWTRFIPQPMVSKREITVLLQDLALLMRSGLPLDDALRLLSDNTTKAMARLIDQLRRVIGSGGNFADALQSQPVTALPDLVAVVKSAEAAGNLENALSLVAEERVKQERVGASIRAAVRYPVFLLIVSMTVLIFFLLFVMPQFADVVRDFGGRPDPLVTTVMAISDAMRENGDAILIAFVVSLIVGLLGWQVKKVRKQLFFIVSRLPGIRGVLELRRTTHFCRGLGMLLGNGVSLTDALRLLSEGHADNDRLGVISDHIRRGGRLVDAIAETDFVPALAARMLRVGEESGSLDAVATRCADYYETKLTERIDKLAGVVGPAAIVFISALVGALIVSVMSTLLSINRIVM
jgi:general secretion pathway protein F